MLCNFIVYGSVSYWLVKCVLHLCNFCLLSINFARSLPFIYFSMKTVQHGAKTKKCYSCTSHLLPSLCYRPLFGKILIWSNSMGFKIVKKKKKNCNYFVIQYFLPFYYSSRSRLQRYQVSIFFRNLWTSLFHNAKHKCLQHVYLFLFSADFDVDGGRDLDIFDINEGMSRQQFGSLCSPFFPGLHLVTL